MNNNINLTSEEERTIELHVNQCHQALVEVAREYVRDTYMPDIDEVFGYSPNQKERKGVEYILELLIQDIRSDLLPDMKFNDYLCWYKETNNGK